MTRRGVWAMLESVAPAMLRFGAPEMLRTGARAMLRTGARAMLLAGTLSCLLAACRAQAGPLALPAAPKVAFAPIVGARLPLEARFTDERGRKLRLGELFGGSPVVLVPGYYTCPNLCSTLFEGVLQALALSGLAGSAYRLVGVSVDPADTPARAAAKKQAYGAILPAGAGLVLLSGTPTSIAALSAALGYSTQRDAASGELAHAAGFVVATPEGRVAHIFPGMRFDPAALRAALAPAPAGRPAAAPDSLGERLLLLCAHFNPASGRHSGAAWHAVRAGAVLLPLALLGCLWRRRVRGERR